jgi:hypothetical protein
MWPVRLGPAAFRFAVDFRLKPLAAGASRTHL